MEGYMLILYVTLNQEEAIKQLFLKQGWTYLKKDESCLYDEVTALEHNVNKLSNIGSSQAGCIANTSQTCNIIDSPFRSDIKHSIAEKRIKDKRDLKALQICLDISALHNGNLNISNKDVLNMNQNTSSETDNMLDFEQDVNSVYVEQVKHVGNQTIENENKQSGECSETADAKVEESSPCVVNESNKKSSEQLQHLISRGKLLSIENKRKINSDRQIYQRKYRKKAERSRYTMPGKKKPIFCCDCKVTFTSQKRYDTHKERNNGQCVFPCKYCDKVFLYRKSRYDLHVRSAHSKDRPFKCDVCQKGYITSDKLKIHKRVHTGERPCVCEECGKAFYSRGDLSTHREYHHISKERQDSVTCDICNVTFCNQRYLVYHKNVTHSSARDFNCQICSKDFKSNSSLNRHLKYIHSDSKNFKCDACDKSFKTAGSLKKHKVRHVGERSFFCSECNKGFYEKAKLDQHYRTHTGEKPYTCHLCEYRCALSGNLSKHMKTHYRELTNAIQ